MKTNSSKLCKTRSKVIQRTSKNRAKVSSVKRFRSSIRTRPLSPLYQTQVSPVGRRRKMSSRQSRKRSWGVRMSGSRMKTFAMGSLTLYLCRPCVTRTKSVASNLQKITKLGVKQRKTAILKSLFRSSRQRQDYRGSATPRPLTRRMSSLPTSASQIPSSMSTFERT